MADPKTPQRVLNWYGLENLGFGPHNIPLTGSWRSDQITIESICYRISHRRTEGGLDRDGHLKALTNLMWNDPEVGSTKKFVHNSWSDKMFLEACREDELGVAGCTSAGKSDPFACYGLLNYIVDPHATLVLFMSTTLSGAKKRIWKTFREYWDAIPGLPGKALWSTNEIKGLSYDGTSYGESSGIYLLASEQSNEKSALDKLIGIKAPRMGEPEENYEALRARPENEELVKKLIGLMAPRMGSPAHDYEELRQRPEYDSLVERFEEDYLKDLLPRLQNLSEDRIGRIILIIDEATGCAESILNVINSNLKPGNVGHFQVIMLGNPNSHFDTFGIFCTPEDGWNNLTLADEEWRTKTGGKVIRFNGEKNPRITEKNDKLSWMLRESDVKVMEETYGRESLYYYRMALGMWYPAGVESGVYSQADIESSDSMGKAVWGYEKPIRISALDPSFTTGGDRASCTFANFGIDNFGKQVLERTEEITLKIDPNNTAVPPSYQVVRQWRKECEARGVHPNCACFDATGGGVTFGDIVRTQWSPQVQPISAGGKASKTPVGNEKGPDGKKILCIERYANKATEIWYGAHPFFRSGQIKGMTATLAKLICSRQHEKNYQGDGRTLKVESKRVFKSREGHSPDEADSFFLLIEHAKTRHGFKPTERAAEPDPGSPDAKKAVTWKSFVNRARKVTVRMGLARILLFAPLLAPLIANADPVSLHWDATPTATSYRVYRGIDVIAEMSTNAVTVDLPVDVETTLTLTAVNVFGESDHSDPLVILPVTPESSVDLISWKRHRAFFVKKESRGFFRLAYPTP